MPKAKNIDPVLSPGLCLRNLERFNESVLGLCSVIRIIVDDIPERSKKSVLDALAEVRKFYKSSEE